MHDTIYAQTISVVPFLSQAEGGTFVKIPIASLIEIL